MEFPTETYQTIFIIFFRTIKQKMLIFIIFFRTIKQKMAEDPEHCTPSYVVQSILERDAEVQPMKEFNTEAPQSAMIQASRQQHPQ